MKIVKLFFAGFFIFHFIACEKPKPTKAESPKIVELENGAVLYQKDIKGLLPENYSQKDSLEIINAYIKNWVKRQLIYQNAQKNINNHSLEDIQKQVNQYKEDLVINAYLSHMINEDLKNPIDVKEMLNYYEINNKNFVLNEDIAQINYVVVPSQDMPEVESLFKTKKWTDIETMAKNKGWSHSIKDTLWINLADATGIFPFNPNENISSKDYFLTENHKNYFIQVKTIKKTAEIAPYEYVKQTIKNILINKRRLNLLKNFEDKLYHDATRNQKIKYY